MELGSELRRNDSFRGVNGVARLNGNARPARAPKRSGVSEEPYVSVIIPVRNAAAQLRRCLASLAKSTFPDYECFVVDDASTDDSPQIARRYGHRVIQLKENLGPALARNRAAQVARGEILLFIDADCCVEPELLQRVAGRFTENADLDALIGSYDDKPDHPGFLSQYKNLAHHFYHQTGNEWASTFWSGCGAVRREVFLRYGGFSDEYKRPAIEDIELGYRMRNDGCQILLDKSIRVKHLKCWTFWGLLKTDIFDRGIPWTQLILRHAHMPADLNLRVSQRLSVALASLAALLTAASAFVLGSEFVVPATALLLLSMSAFGFCEWRTQENTRLRLLVSIAAMAMVASLVVVWPHVLPTVIGLMAGVGIIAAHQHRWLTRPTHRSRVAPALVASVAVCGVAAFLVSRIPFHVLPLSTGLFLGAVLLVNRPFYRFLKQKQNLWFAVAAAPFHLLYYLYSGLSFIAGTLTHLWGNRTSRPLVRTTRRPRLESRLTDYPQSAE